MSEYQEIKVKLESINETEIQPISIIEVEEPNIKKELDNSTQGKPPKYQQPVCQTVKKRKIPPRQNELANNQECRVSIENANKLKLKQPQHHCEHCGSGFLRLSNLTIHIRRKMCIRNHQTCSKCQKVFTSQENLAVHMLSHTNCDVCGEKFDESKALEIHKKTQHNKIKMRHKCLHPDCNKSFNTATILFQHTKYAHEKQNNIICSICKKSFELKSYLKVHMLRHKKIKPFKCEECDRAFTTSSDLARHIRRHTGERPHACDVCQKTYRLLNDLSIHKRIHTGERPYACDLCPMRFVHLSTVKRHRLTHTGKNMCK